MQTVEILLEEHAQGVARPFEVVADAPVSTLIPALVEQLQLPRTDLFGQRLTYLLRHSAGGRIIPDQATLLAVGVQRGSRLSLDSYVEGSPVASPEAPNTNLLDPTFYGALTLDNVSSLPNAEPPVAPNKRPKRSSRRAFLLLGGAVLGVASTGAGYAAYRAVSEGKLTMFLNGTGPVTMTKQKAAAMGTQKQPAKPAVLPTLATTIFSFKSHTQTVRSLGWSADGKFLASGADDQRVFIWTQDGMVQQQLQLPASVRALSLSPDGRVAAGAGTQVFFYNAQNGQLLAQPVRRHAQTINTLSWNTHGQMQLVSGAQDTRAIVWDTTTYQPLFAFQQHTSAVQAVSWSADGQTIASTPQTGIVRVWNGTSGREIHGYYLDAAILMRALAFAPTGGQLAVGGSDGIIRLWNALQCQQQGQGRFGLHCTDQPQRLQVTKSAIRSLAWSPDGRFLLSGSDDGTIAFWYPAQKQAPLFLLKQNGPVRALAWSPDGKLFASTGGTMVSLWKLA